MPDAGPTPQGLKAALKAFKKRLRLTRLDAESSIAGGPLSSGRGRASSPSCRRTSFRRKCGPQLVKQGKLKKAGGGMYELVGE